MIINERMLTDGSNWTLLLPWELIKRKIIKSKNDRNLHSKREQIGKSKIGPVPEERTQ